ncbi:MAG: penicillin-binding protein 2 [Terrimicrobiaceae bacterium]|nr:penicillin-binding protein 2 [Terrimicrobiaceae bacterium]
MNLRAVAAMALLPLSLAAQEVAIDNTMSVENPKPTWETQKQARTFSLLIPAPRGQITDRNGRPLAQTRLSYNLAISFPTPLDWNDERVLAFARQQIALASGLLKRDIRVADSAILTHYRNRGVLPLDIAEDLLPTELAELQRGLTADLILRQTYVRFYPNGSLASHIVGYTGRQAPLSTRPIENNDLIFPESEGREGIEEIFDSELRGQPGILHITFDANGNKMSERIARPPVPGYNVVTTLDEGLQRICEDVLAKNTKRGAIVVIDPRSGEVLAMASFPGFNPNDFVPIVRPDVFQAYSQDPSDPLLPRAYRSAYPPGSTFKTFVGFAALESGKIKPKETFSCPTAFSVGNHTFRNWKKVHAGDLNFKQALTQSCNTWFYQVGIRTGAAPIIEFSERLGLGRRTGIPIRAESAGNIPTDDYMLRVHKRRIKNGDVANMSIGQGDILISPLQMAQAMGVLAASGRFHQTRLVKQVQTIDNKVIAAYPDRVRDEIPVNPDVDQLVRQALVAVTSDGQGTAHRAKVKGIDVAGKTGTAQWGPTERQRIAAWFAGFLPAAAPEYAFAALYEGNPNEDKVGGGSHAAPLIGKVFKEVYHPSQTGQKNEDAPEDEAAATPDESG